MITGAENKAGADCTDSPDKLNITSVTGGTESPEDEDYYVVVLPPVGNGPITVTITGDGKTPCPPQCTCSNQSQPPATNKTPIYTFNPPGDGQNTSGLNLSVSGNQLTWKVDSSVTPAEYTFTLTKVEQKTSRVP